ncbi:MAG: hypothetical protein JW720_06150 [Sedimentisphaerales bacterium]|nr:hypothetical protein [Sedimentisphaerales bacterium]
MKPEEQDKKLDKLISASIEQPELDFDFERWKEEYTDVIEAYEKQTAEKPQTRSVFRLIRGGGLLRFAAAAIIVIGVFLAAQYMTEGLTTIAWADVAERFRSIPFFNATIYIKEDVTSEPKQVELWMSRDGKTRLRTGTQVIFGRQGKVIKAFDIKNKSQVDADEHADFLLQKLGSAKEFSLDSVIKVVFRGKMEDVTPLINPDAVISEDMVVFDIQSTVSPEWLRIWALRESRLPVRIKVWDPRSGDGTDVVFSYSTAQADEFFDPNVFETLLFSRRASSRVNLAYAYLKDPGGRQITPEDMFAESGFHMPEIAQAGITPQGAVWVIAEKGQNRSPEGRSFYGFAEITDDLGREYVRVYSSHETMSDQSKDVFVPLGYPFDTNVPGKITLSCKMDEYNARERDPLIGTIELNEWEQGKMWPEGTIDSSAHGLATTLAWRHANAERYEQAERILAAITGEPKAASAALERERIRLRILVKQKKYEEAVTLGAGLMPAMEENYRRWKGHAPQASDFTDYVLALACTKRVGEAEKVWSRLKTIEPEIPDRLNERARRRIAENTTQGFEYAARLIVGQLSYEARLTVEQINEILDIDIKNNEAFRHYTYWDWNPAYDKPEFKNWQHRLSELAEYYKAHPLPEKMEILKRDKDLEFAARFTRMPGIDTHFAEPLRRKFREYAYFYRYPESAGRLRMEDGLAEMELQHDLIYRVGTEQPEKIAFTLDYFGMEVVEVNEPREVWIAKYDGRKLKDYKDVKATGKATAMSSGGFDLEYLFRSLMDQQNRDLKARGPVIIDETGVREKVSLECPSFEGPEGLETARKWFGEEIGITFEEQTRTITTYVIRKKQ